ncbi:Protein kinase domain [Arabidopsis suecica]|uniref:Protein kinase domain n=1 Tax=Arabidopsis suecica TaxID=45249 RepID=A0A8T2BBQ1_ARASU|nr:Protein kinase domain [Arabidopsis suecica]
MNRRQQVKRRVGKYEVGRTIGEGTFAKVKFARNSETGEPVALKILDKDKVLKHKMAEQIRREIATMNLIKHPNVVQLYEVMASKTKIFIILEYVNDGQIEENEAQRYFQQLIHDVDYPHSSGVYHRDLKVINKIQSLAFVFGVDAGEEEREAASMSKLQRKNDISEGGIMSRGQHSTYFGGPWAKRAEGKEHWHRLTDGGGEWTVRQIGDVSEEDKPGSWMGDSKVPKGVSWQSGADRKESAGKELEKIMVPPSKMEFPAYDGSTNATEWQQKCEDYFDDQGIYNDDAKVRQATFVLTGKTYDLHNNLRRLITHRLGCEEFKKICKSSLRSVWGRQTKLKGKQQLRLFCAGLTDSLRKEVEYLRPETIFKAMEYARDNEYKIEGEKRVQTFGGHTAPTARYSALISKPMLWGYGGSQREKGEDSLQTRPVDKRQNSQKNNLWKKLTESEMAKRRSKGLCFNCADLFAPGHICKPVFIYMACPRWENRMRAPFEVNADIPNGSGWILLATGSTHNFIRSRCPVDGLCKGLSMTVEGHQFEADCFAIPLSGFDVVLGIRWLNALGRVMWDAPARTIEFFHKDMMVKWHGEAKTRDPQGPTPWETDIITSHLNDFRSQKKKKTNNKVQIWRRLESLIFLIIRYGIAGEIKSKIVAGHGRQNRKVLGDIGNLVIVVKL